MSGRSLGRVIATGALLLALPSLAAASGPQGPSGFNRSEYRPVSSISEVPAAVLDLFSSLCGGCALADIGAPFNATDVIQPGLPPRRLLSAGVSGSQWFLEYEHGGRGLHSHFALFALQGGAASCLWANGPPPTGCRPRAAVYEICAW
jgi:hypothetical protein